MGFCKEKLVYILLVTVFYAAVMFARSGDNAEYLLSRNEYKRALETLMIQNSLARLDPGNAVNQYPSGMKVMSPDYQVFYVYDFMTAMNCFWFSHTENRYFGLRKNCIVSRNIIRMEI